MNWHYDNICRVGIIGECMLELKETGAGNLSYAYGGDTLNTAYYLLRALQSDHKQVQYITAIGRDPFSEQMLSAWQAHGILTDCVVKVPKKLPGLYWIKTDSQGERSFHYWRDQSAARELLHMSSSKDLVERLSNYDLVYFSGISIAILDEQSRYKLIEILKQIKACKVKLAFDTNYRPALWPSVLNARLWVELFLPYIDLALLSFDDECSLFSDRSPQDVISRLQSYGISEIIIKNGARTCIAATFDKVIEVPAETKVKQIDTTAAGDSFNAAYIAARFEGKSIQHAIVNGHKLAARVIEYPGALLPD